MSDGYIRLSRKLTSDPWWAEKRPRTKLEAWIDLLFFARYAAGQVEIDGEFVRLGRGEFAASRRFLAERWTWSEKKVRGFLKVAERTGRIRAHHRAHNGAHSTTVYCVVNYDKYQAGATAEGPPEVPPAGQPEGPPRAHLGPKEKKGKSGNEGKEVAPPPPQTAEPGQAGTHGPVATRVLAKLPDEHREVVRQILDACKEGAEGFAGIMEQAVEGTRARPGTTWEDAGAASADYVTKRGVKRNWPNPISWRRHLDVAVDARREAEPELRTEWEFDDECGGKVRRRRLPNGRVMERLDDGPEVEVCDSPSNDGFWHFGGFRQHRPRADGGWEIERDSEWEAVPYTPTENYLLNVARKLAKQGAET